MADGAELLIFVHVPKAGGSTLRSIMMRSVLADERIAMDQPSSALMDMRLRLFAGHVRFGLHHGLTRPVRYVTMLREPVSRYLSDFFYAFQSDDHRLRDEIRSGRLTLEDYLMGRQASDPRGLIRQVAGLDGAATDDVALATRVMEDSYALVGLTERFDESALLLAHLMGWGPPLYLPKNRTRMDPAARRIRDAYHANPLPDVRQRFAPDIAFYEAAERLLDQAIERAGPLFPPALEAYRSLQAQIQAYVAENDPPGTYEQADFRGEDPLPADLRPLARTEEWRRINVFLRADSALRRRRPPLLHGRVDSVRDGTVRGWAVRYGSPEPVPLYVMDEHGTGFETLADLPRLDLEQRGFTPAPRGFEVPIEGRLDPGAITVFFGDSPLRIAVPPPIDLILTD
jgi:hypothetical protein